ncbi:MAG TPA: hypothetical protein PLK41_04165 [Defluviitoga tunisiensis]|nr:hypothetical protein [Defluviitoga tunisiensis]HOL87241.1 hypothetical protein [Defluviitoga tunisiensis]HPP10167.1 hypothetical protein [Defluviitoga tunisiensis]HPZ29585.1 hypothetical protein [Defluviitoga sp.]
MKKLTELISAIIPATIIGPIPGIEVIHSYLTGISHLIVFSIALSTSLISFSKALITLREEEIAIFIGSYNTLSKRYELLATCLRILAILKARVY